MTSYHEAAQKLASYGSDLFLGRIVWYTVTEELNIDHNTFHETMLNNFQDIVEQPGLPGFPRPTDVFKRACTSAQRKNVPVPSSENTYNYMVRPAGHDSDNVWRVIVREEVDPKGHDLAYTELVKVTFNRATEKLRFSDAVPSGPDDTVPSINHDIIKYYNEESERITPYAVRECVRKFLERTLHAVKVRPAGGVYFVNESRHEAIEALDKSLNSLGHGASFHYLPVLDDGKQREMLHNAFEEESVAEIDRLICEMAEIMSTDHKISSERFAGYKVEYDVIYKRIVDYSGLLGEKMEKTANRLEIMENGLMDLMNHVKV